MKSDLGEAPLQLLQTPNPLPFSHPVFTDEDLLAAADCLRRGQVDPSRLVRQLEREIAHKLDIPENWVMCVGSGTAALQVACFLAAGTRYAFSAMTWPATYSHFNPGLHRWWIDVDRNETGQPDYVTRFPVDTYVYVQLWGCLKAPLDWQPANIILDAAHNLFHPLHAVNVRKGATVCYSFGPLKQLTTGRGGCIISSKFEDLNYRIQAEAFIHAGVYNQSHTGYGLNLTMTEPAAAIGLNQLKRWDEMQHHRGVLLAVYENVLKDKLITRLETHSGHLAVARTPIDSLQYLQARFAAEGIRIGHHYPLRAGKCPNAVALSSRVCTLPCHLAMTKHDASKVAELFLEFSEDFCSGKDRE